MRRAVLAVLGAVLVVLYPVAIWLGLLHFDTRTVGIGVLVAVLLVLAVRLRRAPARDRWAVLRVPLVVLVVVGLGVALDDPRLVLAMPVLINATLLVTFGASLRGPVTLIERFARMKEKAELSKAQVAHCRQVTWAWCGLFVINGGASALLAITGPVAWWAAYTGGIAYGLMGALFAGEYILRQYRFRKYGSGLHDRLLARVVPPARVEPAS